MNADVSEVKITIGKFFKTLVGLSNELGNKNPLSLNLLDEF